MLIVPIIMASSRIRMTLEKSFENATFSIRRWTLKVVLKCRDAFTICAAEQFSVWNILFYSHISPSYEQSQFYMTELEYNVLQSASTLSCRWIFRRFLEKI